MKRRPVWDEVLEYACILCDRQIRVKFHGRAPSAICRSCISGIRDHHWLKRHGESKTKLYHVWTQMKYRCTKPSHPCYVDYGGRGITVDPVWLAFPAFRTWALANGYGPGLLLDRRDNDGSYAPDNCRWVTPKTSASNRRMPRRAVA